MFEKYVWNVTCMKCTEIAKLSCPCLTTKWPLQNSKNVINIDDQNIVVARDINRNNNIKVSNKLLTIAP